MANFWYSLAIWFLLFLIYSCAGWIYEVTITFFERRKTHSRGFLIGPVCPIYGCGALFMTALLGSTEDPLIIFLVSMVAAATLEYLVSYSMEKLFGARWWDYEDQAFNVNGRICLIASLAFGVLGLLVIKVLNPFLLGVLGNLDPTLICVVALICAALLLADIIASLVFVLHFRVVAGTVERDATEEIAARVRAILRDQGIFHRRLVGAFPDLKIAPKRTPSPKKPRH